MVWPCTCEGKFCFSHLTYFDSDMIFQFFCSLFVVTRHDVDGCLNLAPSEIGYHVHLVDHSTRVGVLLFAVLQRADESQPTRNSCPRLPHFVDSRFGLYHVAVVLSFLRSPALQKFESFIFWLIRSFTDPAYTCSIFVVRFLAYCLFS